MVGAISEARNAQNIFLERILKIFFYQKGRTVPKYVKRGFLSNLIPYILLQNIKKLEGSPLVILKDFRKIVAHCT